MSPNISDPSPQGIAIPNGYAIRPARASDAPQIAQIFLQAPEAARWSERATWEVLQSPHALAYVAHPVASGEALPLPVVAFAAGRVVVGEAEILNLAVLQDHRRHGLARALVAHLLNEVAGKFGSRVFLEVRESNTAAAELYRRMGFSSLGRRPGYYQDPPEAALILEKFLKQISE